MPKNQGIILDVLTNGNSLCVTLPAQIMKFYGVEEGDKLIIKPSSNGTFSIEIFYEEDTS